MQSGEILHLHCRKMHESIHTFLYVPSFNNPQNKALKSCRHTCKCTHVHTPVPGFLLHTQIVYTQISVCVHKLISPIILCVTLSYLIFLLSFASVFLPQCLSSAECCVKMVEKIIFVKLFLAYFQP